ncbi:right-handed parallel beta-helix repeat-containing protein [Brevibacillus migulae]|uniref:right-handed parallel beta-helix repeat-containing protein n=1 Tax=Brevibacillus migulae TaxID=1644114 RepID=UPI00196AA69B|nr:glycosyl hydrolase family 28-related protein [Brevibacillus migulae]
MKQLILLLVLLFFMEQVARAAVSNTIMIDMKLPVYNVKEGGAVGNGIVNDTNAIQGTLDQAAKTGGTVYFPLGRYLVDTIQVKGNNLKLMGNSAVLLSNHPKYEVSFGADVVRKRSLVNTDLSKQTVLTHIPYERDIRKGQKFLEIPGTVDIDVIQENDLVMVTTEKGDTWAPSYKHGSLRYITSIDRKKRTIHLDSGIETNLRARKENQANDDVKLFIYRPLQNFHMEGLTFELKENGRQNGVFLDFVKNANIQNVRLIGKGQNLTGISISGFDIEISNVYTEGFLSDEMEIGYGVNVAGHHIKVHDSMFINGKHAISGADRRYRNKDFEYYRNTVIDPQSAALEAHGTGENIRIHHNTILDIGKSFVGCGIWVRGKHYQIYENTIMGAATRVPGSSCGIKILESAIGDITISNNRVTDVAYGFMTDLWKEPEAAINVVDNTFINAETGMLLIKLHNAEISANKIAANQNGIVAIGGNNISIANNDIFYERSFGMILQHDPKEPSVTKGIAIKKNKFTPGRFANNIIRIQKGYDDVTISENIFNTVFSTQPFLIINVKQAINLRRATILDNQVISNFYVPITLKSAGLGAFYQLGKASCIKVWSHSPIFRKTL